jgi:hypothetical protein
MNLLDRSGFVRCVDPNSVAALEHDPARLAVLLGEKLLGCAQILAHAGGLRMGVAGGPIRRQTIAESVKMVGTGKSSEFVSVYTAAPS